MKSIIFALAVLSLLAVSASHAAAVEVTVSQAGADSDEIMKSRTFTVEASGWSGECTTAQISFSGCSGCSLSGESYTKSVGSESTVTWTTVTASQKASAQGISVSMGGGCGESGVSSGFDVVMPPSLSIVAETTVSSVDAGSTFPVDISIVNSGETSANSVAIAVGGSGMSIASGCGGISSLAEEQSAAQPCTVTASTGGTQTVTFTVSASNADDAADSFSMEVIGGDEPDGDSPGGNGPGGGLGGGLGTPAQNRTRTQNLNPGTGLMNNVRLQAAMEKVLGQAHMSEQARQNLMDISARITGDFSSSHGFTYDGTRSRIRNTIKYAGEKKAKNFMLFESVPKTFAQSASQVTVSAPGGSVQVADEDPSWVILYPEVSPGEELTVTYEVTGMKSEGVLDNFTTEVYAESLVEAAAGGTGEEAPAEETPAGEEGPGGMMLPSFTLDKNTMLIAAGIVIGVVVIAAAALLMKRRRGGKKSAPAAAVDAVKHDLGQQSVQAGQNTP